MKKLILILSFVGSHVFAITTAQLDAGGTFSTSSGTFTIPPGSNSGGGAIYPSNYTGTIFPTLLPYYKNPKIVYSAPNLLFYVQRISDNVWLQQYWCALSTPVFVAPVSPPSQDTNAYQVMGNIGALTNSMTASVKIITNDGKVWSANVGPDGTWGMYFPGDEGNQTFIPVFTYYDQVEPGSTPIATYTAQGASVVLPPYDYNTNVLQTTNEASLAPITRSTVGEVVGSDGATHNINQYSGGAIGTVTASGTGTGVDYAIQGAAVGSGAGGSFLAASNAIPQDNADIKNLLREANIERKAYGDANHTDLVAIQKLLSSTNSATNSPSPTPSPTPTPTPTPNFPIYDASTATNYFGSKLGTFNPSGYMTNAPTAVSTSQGGGSDFWQITGFGKTFNFNPATNADVSFLANWVFSVITWLGTGYLFYSLTIMFWETMVELGKTPQIQLPELQTSGEAFTFGGSFNLGIFVLPVYAVWLIAGLTLFYTVISTIINTKVGLDVPGLVSTGDSLLRSGGNGPFSAAWNLFLWFVPVGHLLNCYGTFMWFLVCRVPLYLGWASLKAWMPGA